MEEHIKKMVKQLTRLGFDGEQQEEPIREFLEANAVNFELEEIREFPGGFWMAAQVSVSWHALEQDYAIQAYLVQMHQSTNFAHQDIGTVCTQLLDQRMAMIDWMLPYEKEYAGFFSDDEETIGEDKVTSVLTQLWKLGTEEPYYGVPIRDKLMFKYLSGTPFEKYFDLTDIKGKFLLVQSFKVEVGLPKLQTNCQAMIHDMKRSWTGIRRPRTKPTGNPCIKVTPKRK